MATRRSIRIHSATGFANAAGECGGRRINLEVCTVNHHYLDAQFRMPEELRYLEGTLRGQITAAVAHGKLECHIQLQDVSSGGQTSEVNQDLVTQPVHLNKTWRKKHDFAKLSVANTLRFPDVLTGQGEGAEASVRGVKDLLTSALKESVVVHKHEGKELGEHLPQRLDGVEEIVGALNELFPSPLQAHMGKVKARSAGAVDNINNDRLQQEFALFVQKSNVNEELSRSRAHIAKVYHTVTEGKGNVGKRLDFLMQELSREANTLDSKAIAVEHTQASIELKVLTKRMREQVQSIE